VFDAPTDNIDVDSATGDLIAVGCPTRYKVAEYFSDPKVAKSPTQVLKFKTEDGLITDVEQIYMNDGEEFSGGSVGTIYKNRLLLGAVATAPMICEIK